MPLQFGGTLGFGSMPQYANQQQMSGYYNQLLQGFNQQYQNTLQGYNAVLANQEQAQQGVQAGYQALQGQVMDDLAGVEAPQRQQIAELYAQQQGKAMQGLASAGLGNTTVGASVSRGILADRVKRENELTGQMGQLRAGYRSGLGQAALGYQGQAIRDRAQLAGSALQFQGDYGARIGAMMTQAPGQAIDATYRDHLMRMDRERLNYQIDTDAQNRMVEFQRINAARRR